MENAAVILIPMVFWIAMLTLVIVLHKGENTPKKRLEEFADKLEGGRLVKVPWTQRVIGGEPWTVAEGRWEGRTIRLGTGSMISLQMRVPGSASFGRLTIRKKDLLRRAGRSEGKSHEAEVRRAVGHFFQTMGLESITLHKGWLKVGRAYSNYAMTDASIHKVFENLAKIAPLYERQEVDVRVLGIKGQAWTAGGSGMLCPYCRDEVREEGPTLRACDACSTIHHAECLDEAGGCTVFGCRAAPKRVRA